MNSISKDLNGAASTLFILAILNTRDSYGFEMVQEVILLSNNQITWKIASIYPVLKKMELSNLIKSYWKVEKNQRPRKYYTILADGKEQLDKNVGEWEMINSVLEKLLGLSRG